MTQEQEEVFNDRQIRNIVRKVFLNRNRDKAYNNKFNEI